MAASIYINKHCSALIKRSKMAAYVNSFGIHYHVCAKLLSSSKNNTSSSEWPSVSLISLTIFDLILEDHARFTKLNNCTISAFNSIQFNLFFSHTYTNE